MKYLAIALIFLASFGTAVAGDDVPAANGKIDGLYAELPSEASEPAQMTIALAGLLLTSSRFDHVEISGKLERIKIAGDADSLRVIAYDSAGHAVVDDVVKAECRQKSGCSMYILERQWELPSSGETGAATGKTTVVLSKDDDGNLRADVTAVSVGKSFFSSKTPTESHHWLKYHSITPSVSSANPEPLPKKKNEDSANGLFGR